MRWPSGAPAEEDAERGSFSAQLDDWLEASFQAEELCHVACDDSLSIGRVFAEFP